MFAMDATFWNDACRNKVGMIPTPDIGHLRQPKYRDNVYDPAEDTFALMDALEQDIDTLKALDASLCVEIG